MPSLVDRYPLLPDRGEDRTPALPQSRFAETAQRLRDGGLGRAQPTRRYATLEASFRIRRLQVLGITDYSAFVVAVLIFLMIPGPGTFCLLTSTGKGGLRAGAAATAGLIAGDQVLMWLAAAGVAAVLQAQPVLFKGLQYVGAAYLAWIGFKLAFRPPGSANPIEIRPRHYARQGFLITLMNPKAIVFYMAFFPLFIDPARHQGLVTFGAMALTIAGTTLAYCLTLCAFASVVAEKIRANRLVARGLERGAGVVLIAFGIRLGTQ